MSQYLIKDEGDLRKYFIQIPNSIDDSDLTVYEFRLYVHLKRVAGDEGKCYQSTQTLAKSCMMSTAAVSRAKKRLAEKKLIEIAMRPGEHGGRDYHEITIVDIWDKNMASYSQKQQVTGSNLQVTTVPLASYPGAIKEEPIKNNKDKEEEDSKRPNIFAIYESNIGSITKIMADKLIQAEKDYSEEWITEAVSIAVTNNARKWSYIEAILKDWQTNGYKNDKRKPARANSKTSSEPAGFANLRKAAERWSGNNE